MIHRSVDDPFNLVISHHVHGPRLNLWIIPGVENKEELFVFPGRLLCTNNQVITESILCKLICEEPDQL